MASEKTRTATAAGRARGSGFPPGAKPFLPASIERSVWENFAGKAEQKGVNLLELSSDCLEARYRDQ
jgi:hypothetical protein